MYDYVAGNFFLNFALNRTNYACHGSFYVSVLQNIESIYLGLKTLLETKRLSVQAKNCYPLLTAIDQRGEQTLNKDAKSYIGIKYFASNESSVLKWTSNQAKQAENTKALVNIAGLGEEQTMYKPLQLSQILKSKSSVQSLVRVMETEYVNPFDSSLDKSKLYHLTSGTPIAADTATGILNLSERGTELATKYVNERIKTNEVNL